jgi:hypothetical protein
MRRSTLVAGLATIAPVVLMVSACSDQALPTESARAMTPPVSMSKGPQHAGGIVAHDQCEPESFNGTIGEGTCVRHNGGTTFGEFIAELTATRTVVRWNFTPSQLTARLGVDLLGNNVGGEEHTFTPVAQFGGGVVPILNQLSGTPVPAPECLALDEDDLVPAGGKYLIEAEELADAVDASGIARVMCCIHPWMRATVRMQR